MLLPNFLIIGAAKAGTSSLHRYLAEHPQVVMSRPKEPRFFNEEYNWNKGLEWYEQCFVGAEDARAIGEASTFYTKYPHMQGVPARIAETIPHAKLIYLMRHPIDRMRSQYLFRVARGQERRSLADALLSPEYLDVSSYALQIEQFLEFFSRDRLLLITSEELRSERLTTLKRVYAFLEVDETGPIANMHEDFNITAKRPRVRPAARRIALLPGYKRVASLVPPSVKEIKRKIAAPPAATSATPEIPRELESQLEDLLRDDLSRLRRYMPAGFDGWGIAWS